MRACSVRELHHMDSIPINSLQSDNLPQPSKFNSPPLKIKGLVALHSSILKNYVEQPKTIYQFFIIFIPTIKFQITAKN